MRTMLIAIMLLAVSSLLVMAQPTIGIYDDAGYSICYGDFLPQQAHTVWIAAWLPPDIHAITACEFSIPNLPEPDEAVVTAAWTTNMVVGNIYSDISLAWTTYQVGPWVLIGTITITPLIDFHADEVVAVAEGEGCDCLVIVDDVFEQRDAEGLIYTMNCSTPSECSCTPHGDTPGMIVAWGQNDYGQCGVPEPNADFVAVAGGYHHSLGLKSDSSIAAWGYNYYGQCNVPAPNTDFVEVAGGEYHSMGLKSDGSVVAWGRNDYSQCNVPAPNADFVAVAGGGYHSLGLKSDGSIVAWGANSDGQCNVPAPNEDFMAVAGGAYHSLGLKSDGSIVAWGYNSDGQCNVPAPNADFVAMTGRHYHSLGLKSGGWIVAWGNNYYNQCNVPAPNADFVAVAGGGFHSLGLKSDGSVVAWGRNDYSQCDIPVPNADFRDIAAGYCHSLGLRIADLTGLHEVAGPGALGEHLLAQNYPNPFGPATEIRFSLTEASRVSIQIFDLSGRKVRDLLTSCLYAPGAHAVPWDGKDNASNRLGSGIYLYRLQAGDQAESRKMILRR